MQKKKRSQSLIRTILSILLIMVLTVTIIPPVQSEASARSKALAQYKTRLSQKRIRVLPQGVKATYDYYYYQTYYSSPASRVKFCVAYIDGDNVPDLILQDPLWGYGVWTYIGKSFRCLKWSDCYCSPVGYYKKKGIFRENESTEGTPYYRNYYKLKTGTKPKEIQHINCDDMRTPETVGFYVGKKKVSSSAFYKNLKKYVGKTKMTMLSMHWDTWSNRKKYIK